MGVDLGVGRASRPPGPASRRIVRRRVKVTGTLVRSAGGRSGTLRPAGGTPALPRSPSLLKSAFRLLRNFFHPALHFAGQVEDAFRFLLEGEGGGPGDLVAGADVAVGAVDFGGVEADGAGRPAEEEL